MTVDLYGHAVDLRDQGDGYVTDVVVLARVVRHNEDGDAYDSFLASVAPQGTEIVQVEMTFVPARVSDSPFTFYEAGGREDE